MRVCDTYVGKAHWTNSFLVSYSKPNLLVKREKSRDVSELCWLSEKMELHRLGHGGAGVNAIAITRENESVEACCDLVCAWARQAERVVYACCCVCVREYAYVWLVAVIVMGLKGSGFGCLGGPPLSFLTFPP